MHVQILGHATIWEVSHLALGEELGLETSEESKALGCHSLVLAKKSWLVGASRKLLVVVEAHQDKIEPEIVRGMEIISGLLECCPEHHVET